MKKCLYATLPLFLFLFNHALAYVPLSNNLPISSSAGGGGGGDLQGMIVGIFTWGVSIAGLLAIIYIVIGGVQYMTTDSIFNKEDGKNKIQSAVVGLLIVLAGWLILNEINPSILTGKKLELEKKMTINVKAGKGGQISDYVNEQTKIPDYKGTEKFIPESDGLKPKLTAYSPQKKGSGLIKMEGGYESSIAGLDGKNIVRTLEDYSAGKTSYITLAGDSSQYGKSYIIPEINYINRAGQNVRLQNVPGYVHDTGSAFAGAGNTKFDIPIFRDGNNSQMASQPFNGNNIIFIPATIEK
jgi:hypothetical protein